MTNPTTRRQALDRNIQKARESGIIISTFESIRYLETISEPIRARLRGMDLWDVNPPSLFRVTWRNGPMKSDKPYRAVSNYIELSPTLASVPTHITALVGKWFPTGYHKVRASFDCLAPQLVTE